MFAVAPKEHRILESLCQEISTIKFRTNFTKLENALLTCIMNKMLVEINVLSTITDCTATQKEAAT